MNRFYMFLSRTMIFSFLLLSCHALAGKDWKTQMKNPDASYEEIKDSFESYWKQRHVSGKKPGYKQFQRWEHFISSRLDQDGRINVTQELWDAHQKFQRSQSPSKTNGDFSGKWRALGPFHGPNGRDVGRVNAIISDPNDKGIFYVATPAAGIWKTTDGGINWQAINGDMPTFGSNSLVLDPRDSNVIYAATGDPNMNVTQSIGILKSVDGGATWTRTLIDGVTQMYTLLISPTDSNTLLVATNTGVFKSTDGGTSWRATYSLDDRNTQRMRDIAYKPGNAMVVHGVTHGAMVYRSDDGGESWQFIDDFQGARSQIAVTPANPDYVYVLASNGSNLKGVYRSTDGGSSYSLVTDSPNILGRYTSGTDTKGQAWYDMTIAVSPTDPELLFVGGINIWKSTDGGQTWKYTSGGVTPVHADIHYLGFHHGALFTGCDGGVYYSQDDGGQWGHLNDTLNIMQFYRLGTSRFDPGHILGGSQDNGTSQLRDGAWTKINGSDGMECAVDLENGDIVYFSTQNGNFYRRDQASGHFRGINPRGENGSSLTGAWVTPMELDPIDHGTIYLGFQDLYKSTDRGDTWTKISNLNGSSLGVVEVSAADNKVITMASTNASSFHRSTDGGATWARHDLYEIMGRKDYPGIQDILADANDPQKLWLAVKNHSNSDQHVLFSQDGGKTFVDMSTGLPQVKANSLVQDIAGSERIYVGTDLGVFYREAGMVSWISFNQDMPPVIINELEINYETKMLRAATFSRGMWESPLYSSVKEAPLAFFSANFDYSCGSESVVFQDHSTGLPHTREWQFPGGQPATSTLPNPTVVYATSGVYDVTLTVTNDYGTQTITKREWVAVNEPLNRFPWVENFDNLTAGATSRLFNNWINLNDDQTDWMAATTGVLDGGGYETGPATDQSGQGTYLYLPNATRVKGTNANLLSPCLDLTNIRDPKLKLWHYLKGSPMDHLSIDVLADGVWHEDVAPAVTGTWNATWKRHLVDLSAFSGKNIRIRIRAVSNNRMNVRIAIDELELVDDPSSINPVIGSVNLPQDARVDFPLELSAEASDPNNLDLHYRWEIDKGVILTGANVTHHFSAAGTYPVVLRVSNPSGGEAVHQAEITVTGEPNIAPVITHLSWTPERPKVGETVTFRAEATDANGDPLDYTWNFGFRLNPGQQGQEITYNFPNEGRHYVNLWVNDGRPNGGTSQSIEVFVTDELGADLLYVGNARTDLAGKAGEGLLFKVVASNDLGDLSISTTGGTGDVDLYVKTNEVPTTTLYDFKSENNNSEESIQIEEPDGSTLYILVHGYSDFSAVTLNVNGSWIRAIRMGESLSYLNAKAGDTLYYRFDTGADDHQITIQTGKGRGDLDLYVREGGKATPANYDHSSTNAGNDEIIQIENAANKTFYIGVHGKAEFTDAALSLFKTVQTNREPVIDAWSFPERGLVNEKLEFSIKAMDPDGDTLKIVWDFIDGTNQYGTSITRSFEREGTYPFTVTVDDGNGGIAKKSGSLNIVSDQNKPPIIEKLNVPNQAYLEETITLSVVASDPDGDQLSYHWELGDGNLTSGATLDYSYSREGTYLVSVTVSDDRGGSVTQSVSIQVVEGDGVAAIKVDSSLTGLGDVMGGQAYYKITVPHDMPALRISTLGGHGDVDLFVREGQKPTLTQFDARSWYEGNREEIDLFFTAGRTYYILLNAFTSYDGLMLAITSDGLYNLDSNAVVEELYGFKDTIRSIRIEVPEGVETMTLTTTGGTGDMDLYLTEGSDVVYNYYDFISDNYGNEEEIKVANAGGRTFVLLQYAYKKYAGVTFKVNFN